MTEKTETPNFSIEILEGGTRGYFEHHTFGDECGGGLWFERDEDGHVHLIDYDGVFSLPSEVKQALINWGIHVSEEF